MKGEGLPEQHERHLRSAFAVLSEYCHQVEALVSHGTPPPGAEPGLSPLPPEEGALLLRELKGLRDSTEEGLHHLAPAHQQGQGNAAAMPSTLVWISVLLEHIRDLVEEFEPRRMARRYGELPAGVARRVETLHRELSARVSDCRSVVDRWRRATG